MDTDISSMEKVLKGSLMDTDISSMEKGSLMDIDIYSTEKVHTESLMGPYISSTEKVQKGSLTDTDICSMEKVQKGSLTDTDISSIENFSSLGLSLIRPDIQHGRDVAESEQASPGCEGKKSKGALPAAYSAMNGRPGTQSLSSPSLPRDATFAPATHCPKLTHVPEMPADSSFFPRQLWTGPVYLLMQQPPQSWRRSSSG
ncbi:hypothetical protein ACOMHN_000269 [Nucella lapillus]